MNIVDKKTCFGLISEIDSENPATWLNKIFLTFDIDWADDEVIRYTVSLLEENNARATWFATHESPILDELRSNKNFELGIHPNFNNLLNGDPNNKTSVSIIKELKEIVPEAKSLRSHSLTQSERLLDIFAEFGIYSVCNTFIPNTVDFRITPWKMWDNISIIPHSWQDNVSFKIPLNGSTEITDSLCVYNFHPIHVFLNSENLERYESTRQYHRDVHSLRSHRNTGDGIENKLLSIIQKII